MGEKRHRSTKKEALNAKLQTNAEKRAKIQAKLKALDELDADLKRQLQDLMQRKEKAANAAQTKALRGARKKEKEFLDALKKSGISLEDALEKINT